MEKRFELRASSEILSPFRKELRVVLDREGWEKQTVSEILLTVDEALTNIIRHAYAGKDGKIVVTVKTDRDHIEIVLEDWGKKFDPTQVPSPELPRQKPGGLGVHFIRTIMDEMIYDSHFADGNRLRLLKHKTKS